MLDLGAGWQVHAADGSRMLDPQGRGIFFHKWMVEVPTVRGVHRKRYVFCFIGRASLLHDLVSTRIKVLRSFAV